MSAAPSRPPAAHWHLLTGDYPPRLGGVADYTRLVARALAAEGEVVHVWASGRDVPGAAAIDAADAAAGVTVHRVFERFTPAELAAAAGEARRDAAARWMVQWVPHQFGWKALNAALPLWMAARHRAGDEVDLMVHEGGVPFARGRWRQNVAAVVHRLMLRTAVAASDRVWLSVPGWDETIQRYGARPLPPRAWLPIPSTIPVIDDRARVAAWRARLAPDGRPIVGHFGTHGGPVGELTRALVPAIAARAPGCTIVLAGARSDSAAAHFVAAHPRLAGRVVGVGALEADELSCVLQACDVMAQPYPDGVSGRRTSTLAALAHGVPVVTNVGALSEPLWQGGGVVLATPDPAAQAAAVAALLDDAGARLRVAALGHVLYDASFAIERTVAVLLGRAPAASPTGVTLAGARA